MEKKASVSQGTEGLPTTEEELFGIDPDMSLQSVNFATTETPDLNERRQNKSTEE